MPGLYAHDTVILHNQKHDGAETFRYPGVNQYKLEVEAFARVAGGAKEHYFTLESSKKNQLLIDAIFAAGKSGQLGEGRLTGALPHLRYAGLSDEAQEGGVSGNHLERPAGARGA